MDPKVVDSAKGFITILNWKRVAMVFALVLIAGGATFAWLARDSIVQVVKPSKFSTKRLPLVVDDRAKKAIEDTLRKAPIFVAIAVTSVDAEANTRRIVYFKSLDPAISRIQQDYADTHPAPDIALFNDDQANNNRVIRLIGGEMVCLDFKDARSAPYLAEVKDGIKYVCATGTPPYFGEFRGTVIAYLKVVPTNEEQVQIRILLRDLSNALDNPSDRTQYRPKAPS